MTSRSAVAALLADLAPDVAFPATPPLVEVVADRIAGVEPLRPRRRLVWRVAAVAAVVAVVLTAGVPAARRAVADLLGLGPIGVSQVAHLTPAATVGDLGQLTTVAAASAAVDFDLVGLEGIEPDAVFLDTSVAGGMVTFAYGSPTEGWTLLITQFDGAIDEELARKETGPGTTIEPVTVAGAEALWISGAPHTLLLLDAAGEVRADEARLAGNTLLTTRHGVPVRIEADAPLGEVIRIAERLVPTSP
jgi:hypothetical protein